MSLRCMSCGQEYPLLVQRTVCDCGGLLDVVQDLEALRPRVSRALFDDRLGRTTFPYGSGVWRYAELLFDAPAAKVVSKPEGNTNLYRSQRLSRWLGLDDLQLKHEGENPTGSFKDRGMTTGATHANMLGAKVVVCASTGNTSASVAAYAASAGMQAVIFIPAGNIALGKLSQSIAYGAKNVQIQGDFDAGMAIVRRLGECPDVYVLNSINAFRVEGQKSIGFEIVQQREWEPPDWIVVPGGNLANGAAIAKGLYELRELGLISKLPRFAIVQAEGANPLYRWFRNGFSSYEPVKAETIATAIKIGDPVSYPRARRAIEWTNGVVEQVTDAEIMNAKAQVDAAGIGCEPASAASIAGLRKLLAAGTIGRGESVVAILTGHLLKDPDATVKYHANELAGIAPAHANPLVGLPADYDAIRRYLDQLVEVGAPA